jgi:hypothetical protein
MKISEIIECFNKSINIQEGHFIIHTSVTSNNAFKIYKEIEYTLWFVPKGKRKNIIVLTESFTEKMSDTDKEKVLKETDKKFISTFFKWILEKGYLEIIEEDETT